MQQHTAPLFGSRSFALLGLVCALGLSSCSDENTPGWWKKLTSGSSAETAQPAEAASKDAAASEEAAITKDEVLSYMIYNVGNTVRQQASSPLWRAEVRDMRNVLESYYNAHVKNGSNLVESVRLGLFLADTTRDLTAYDKAIEEYTAVLANCEKLTEEQINSVDLRRLRSAIENGLGSCYLAQRKPREAQPHYENALEIDQSIFAELAPADDAPLPTGEALTPNLAKAAEDLLSSIRCLGECQFMAEDPEEARDTFKRGQDLVVRMKNLAPPMSIQYIRLLTDLGNLESSCGQMRQAYAAWMNAASIAQRLRQVAPTPAIQAQAARFLRELEPSIKSVGKQLQDAQAAEAAKAADEQQQ